MSGEYWFEWNGVRSTEYGIYVDTQPPITRPLERVTHTNIPGRSGSLTQTEGEDVYEDLVLTAQCVMKDAAKITEIMRWLKGSGKVVFANRRGGFYYARVNNLIPFDKIVRGRENRAFPIVFRCKPFWYLEEEGAIPAVNGGRIYNTGSVYAEPIITITGSGDGEIQIGETLIELTGIDGSITINSELQEAYSENESVNDKMAGEFPKLAIGENEIRWSGGITSVMVRKNERYL